MHPIGVVRSPFPDSRASPRQARLAPRARGRVVVDEPYRRGLQDLGSFDYLWIVAWLDRPHDPPQDPHRVQPLLRSDGQPVSLFATRCPIRQNPIAFSLAELLHVDSERGELEIRGIDLADGTPVLDLKPYVPAFDQPRPGAPVAAGWYDQEHLAAPLPAESARSEALEAVHRWIGSSKPFVVVQPLRAHGPGVPRGGELCVATKTDVAGELLGGAVPPAAILTLARQALTSGGGAVGPLTVDTGWAIRQAMGAGREVTAVASSGFETPSELWASLGSGLPVALAVALEGAHRSTIFRPEHQGVGPLAGTPPVHAAATHLLGRRHEGSQVLGDSTPQVALQTFFRAPKLLIAGWRALGTVIADVARPMGWSCTTAPEPGEAVALTRELGRLDAVVVLGHDPILDEPVLEAALLPDRLALVGATGAPSVVEDRKRRLAARGVGADAIARLRSPVGLPTGGTTAPELALSVVAELQAARYGP
jgi:tRNA-Thr(GGU) m(6)t(6)A37 methyltransferase TsaA